MKRKKDFSCADAYPLAKKILYRHPEVHDGIAEILRICSRRFPDPIWRKYEKLDYDKDIKAITGWFRDNLASIGKKGFSKKIEIMWLGLLDVEEGFRLRGSPTWSKDPENWEWYYHDRNLDDGAYRSPIMREWTVELSDYADQKPGLRHIAAFFATLTYAGLVGENVFKNLPGKILLGDRKERWLAVGHPDSVYGVILGKRTMDGWVEYRE